MKKHIHILILATLMACALTATAGNNGHLKVFEQYSCRLTLPDPNFEWIDHTQIPQAKAALANDSGAIILFMVNKASDELVINDAFIKGFNESYYKRDVISKISSEMTNFRNVPCYKAHSRLEQENSLATIIIFAANGFVYQLQLISDEATIREHQKLETVFSAFDFLTKPRLHVAKPSTSGQRAYEFGEKMGRILFYCIIGIVILSVIKKLKNRKSKNA
jgi:hypothetical protein